MACLDCHQAQERGHMYWFRWKHANIGLSACPEHTKEVMIFIREHLRKCIEEKVPREVKP